MSVNDHDFEVANRKPMVYNHINTNVYFNVSIMSQKVTTSRLGLDNRASIFRGHHHCRDSMTTGTVPHNSTRARNAVFLHAVQQLFPPPDAILRVILCPTHLRCVWKRLEISLSFFLCRVLAASSTMVHIVWYIVVNRRRRCNRGDD